MQNDQERERLESKRFIHNMPLPLTEGKWRASC
jgi:hypothetical protein